MNTASYAEKIIVLYQRHAKAWASERGNRLFEKAWLDQFHSLLPADAALLDIGCGSGEPIARYFIEQGCHVTGVDSAPDMIAMCKENFPLQAWYVTDMRVLDLGQRFNGILAWDSFFHLCPGDQRAMFPIFRKHAAPQAALMFTSGPTEGEAIGTLRGEPLYHASLDGEDYRQLLAENGFSVVSYIMEDPLCEGRTVWLAKLK